jgi:hypothetical protein
MIKTINKNRFKTLASALLKENIIVEFQVDWSMTTTSGDYGYTDQPRLGTGTYNGIEGWYFTKNDNVNYTNKEKKLIKEVLLNKGFKCKGIDDYEVEWDNDRSYRPTISFILNK